MLSNDTQGGKRETRWMDQKKERNTEGAKQKVVTYYIIYCKCIFRITLCAAFALLVWNRREHSACEKNIDPTIPKRVAY